MNNQKSLNGKGMPYQMGKKKFREANNLRLNFKSRKSAGYLLPTPSAESHSAPVNRQVRRVKSDGDAGSYSWRTYAQAKRSEADVKKKRHMNYGAFYKRFRKVMPQFYQQNQREVFRPDRFMKPRVEKVSAQMKEGAAAEASTTVTVQGQTSGLNLQQVVTRRGIETCPPLYGPFPTVEHGPPPSQDQIAKMYAGMLWSGISENRISSSKKNAMNTGEDCMRYANDNSLGSFEITDSKYGNSLMPTLPRM